MLLTTTIEPSLGHTKLSLPPLVHTLSHKTQCHISAYLDMHISDSISQYSNVQFDTDAVPIIIDSGATCAFMNQRSDFINFTASSGKVSGLGTLIITGTATVRYYAKTIDNKIIPIIIKDTLYVPDLPVRLMHPRSPQFQFQLVSVVMGPKVAYLISGACPVHVRRRNLRKNIPQRHTPLSVDVETS